MSRVHGVPATKHEMRGDMRGAWRRRVQRHLEWRCTHFVRQTRAPVNRRVFTCLQERLEETTRYTASSAWRRVLSERGHTPVALPLRCSCCVRCWTLESNEAVHVDPCAGDLMIEPIPCSKGDCVAATLSLVKKLFLQRRPRATADNARAVRDRSIRQGRCSATAHETRSMGSGCVRPREVITWR